MEIVKSPNDKRIYNHVLLDNKLEILFVIDDEINVSGASMSIGVGYYNDPKKYQGLSHFLEHMLFMGTTKYPDENYFFSYLNKTGGTTNAFTDKENTNYYFSISSDKFLEGVDIFSRFFIDPIFNADAVNREINAVNSEHMKNYNNDIWRIFRIIKIIADEQYPYHKFGTGSHNTLDKNTVRDRMVNFYEKYYSSDIMKLVIIHNNDNIINQIISMFSPIKNKNIKNIIHKSYIGKYPFKNYNNNNACHRLVKMVPITDMNKLIILWTVPTDVKYYKINPVDYIIGLIGHESEGSIAFELKQKHWIYELFISKNESDINTDYVMMTIELTEDGFNNIPTIIKCIYQYINIITVEKRIYDEVRYMNFLKFKYYNKNSIEDYLIFLSSSMHHYPTQDIIRQAYIMQPFDNETDNVINNYLDYFKHYKSIVFIISKKYTDEMDMFEEHYNIPYSKIACVNTYGSEFNYDNNEKFIFSLPKINEYIPYDIGLLEIEDMHEPKLIENEMNKQIFYRSDTKFKQIKGLASVVLYFPNIIQKPIDWLSLMLFINIFRHTIFSKNYYAIQANSHFNILYGCDHVEFIFNSYHNIISRLCKDMLKIFIELPNKISKELLDIQKEKLYTELNNYYLSSPHILAKEYLKEKTHMKYFSPSILIKILNRVTISNLNIINKWFIQQCTMKALIEGNIDTIECNKLTKQFTNFITPNKFIDYSPNNSINEMEKGNEEIYISFLKNPEEKDSAIDAFFLIGVIEKGKSKNWAKKIILSKLLSDTMKEQFFNQMRSKDQLGYIVRLTKENIGNEKKYITGISFVVQTPYSTPYEVRKKIKVFINNMYEQFTKKSDDFLDNYKNSIVHEFEEKDKNIYEQFYRNLNNIKNDSYIFDKADIIDATKNMTMQKFLKYFKKYLIDRQTRMIKIVELNKIK